MKKTQKKGFTLIELMVVIVIIGILAAIAIPKLFGMTAKAKASEVGPAAGTWSKLQQAYMSEKSESGSWVSIAYKAPGNSASAVSSTTANFTYGDGFVSAGQNAAWTAANGKIGGDCTTAFTWTAAVDLTTGVATGAAPSNACGQLTPNFSLLK